MGLLSKETQISGRSQSRHDRDPCAGRSANQLGHRGQRSLPVLSARSSERQTKGRRANPLGTSSNIRPMQRRQHVPIRCIPGTCFSERTDELRCALGKA